jgi:hypothetical protein
MLLVLRSPPWLVWPVWNICVTNDHGYVPLVVSTSRSFPHSWFITGVVTRLIRRVPLMEQELLTFPEHLRSLPVFSGVNFIRSLALCVCFVDRCLSLCTFSVDHFFVCCLFFFDIRILITPLVSSNFSYMITLCTALEKTVYMSRTILSFFKDSVWCK